MAGNNRAFEIYQDRVRELGHRRLDLFDLALRLRARIPRVRR